MKISDDQTLFAWGLLDDLKSHTEFVSTELQGLLAPSPADFTNSHKIHALEPIPTDMPPMIVSNGVRIELPVWSRDEVSFATISCTAHGHLDSYIGVRLHPWRLEQKI